MNPTQLALLQLGLDALVKLWANHSGKPQGWKPTAEDWAALESEVLAATPEAVDEEARKIIAGRPTATHG